jgi:hypothetical protein
VENWSVEGSRSRAALHRLGGGLQAESADLSFHAVAVLVSADRVRIMDLCFASTAAGPEWLSLDAYDERILVRTNPWVADRLCFSRPLIISEKLLDSDENPGCSPRLFASIRYARERFREIWAIYAGRGSPGWALIVGSQDEGFGEQPIQLTEESVPLGTPGSSDAEAPRGRIRDLFIEGRFSGSAPRLSVDFGGKKTPFVVDFSNLPVSRARADSNLDRAALDEMHGLRPFRATGSKPSL